VELMTNDDGSFVLLTFVVASLLLICLAIVLFIVFGTGPTDGGNGAEVAVAQDLFWVGILFLIRALIFFVPFILLPSRILRAHLAVVCWPSCLQSVGSAARGDTRTHTFHWSVPPFRVHKYEAWLQTRAEEREAAARDKIAPVAKGIASQCQCPGGCGFLVTSHARDALLPRLRGGAVAHSRVRSHSVPLPCRRRTRGD
jgi:hypothetical protein